MQRVLWIISVVSCLLAPGARADETDKVPLEADEKQPVVEVVEQEEVLASVPVVTENRPKPEVAKAGFLDCSRYQIDRIHCERLNQARTIITPVPLRRFRQPVGRGQMVEYREFALVVYEEVDQQWHTLILGMPDAVTDLFFQPTMRSVPDPSCRVRRLRGFSLSRMVTEVHCFGRELFVYAGKYIDGSVRDAKQEPNRGASLAVDTAIYLAPPAHLAQRPEIVRDGYRLKMELIHESLRELVAQQVPSRAYSGRLVGEVVREQVIANLGLTEQFDLCFLIQRLPGCKRFVPLAPYQTGDEVRSAINAEFALNGDRAFAYAVSREDARGWLQFTDKHGHGTYSGMVRLQPKARLNPDFKAGARDIRNLIKAAAILVDYELSHPWIPRWVREAFLRDPEFGQVIPGTAYNGSPTQGRRIIGAIERFAKGERLSLETLSFDHFPWERFFQWFSCSANKMVGETCGYIRTMIDNVLYLRGRRPAESVSLQGANY